MSGPVLDREAIRALVPQQGTMCLLDTVRDWSDRALRATARSHLDPGNPLRRDGALAMVCGAEYGFQAAALHGALLAAGDTVQGGTVSGPKRGVVAGLRLDRILGERLDDPAHGLLQVGAVLELEDPGGSIYGFTLHDARGALLLSGRGTIMFPARMRADGRVSS